MFSTGRFGCVVFAGLLLFCAAPVAAQLAPDSALYRVFLRDGSTVISYGEYARVADRIVITLPVGSTLQLLSIPADRVDWEKTDAYADSVRATKYAATRGPDELAQLTAAVSRALNDIDLTADPNRKIAMAAEARQNLMKWTAEHFGYGADRIATMASMFDDAIADAQKKTGAKNVELSLVATMAAPPSMPLLPAPTLQDSMEQALAAATLSPEATERASLLHALQQALTDAGSENAVWVSSLRTRVAAAIAVEERATRNYALLTKTTLQTAERYANAANVTGVERVIRRALGEDDRLGQRRPQEMASLLAMLDSRLDAARRLRLARDNWAMRQEALRKFRESLVQPLSLMELSRPSLDEIRRLAGPPPLRLSRLISRTAAVNTLLATIEAPAEAQPALGLVKNAAQFALRAAQTRQRAVLSGQMPGAWEAASAASGALMFFERANEALQQLAKAPTLPDVR